MLGPALTDMFAVEGTWDGDKLTVLARPRSWRTTAFAKCELTGTSERLTGKIDTNKGAIEFIRKKIDAASAVRSMVTDDRCCRVLGCGGQGRNRTSDTVIFSHVLYQLSYLASRTRRFEAVRTSTITCRFDRTGLPSYAVAIPLLPPTNPLIEKEVH